jgi:hypothetical protein
MRRGSVVGCAIVLSLGCKKTPPPEAGPAPADTPTIVSEPSDRPSPYGSPFGPSDAHELVQPRENGEAPRENGEAPTAEKPAEEPPAPAPVASGPKVDPFESVTAAVRASAVGCFTGQPKGEYGATISVVVTPAGNVSRVEATSSIDDAAVRKCLEQAATRSYPSTENGKKLSIDVRVKG